MDHCQCYLSWVSQSWDQERDSQLVQTAIDLTDIKKCLLGNHTHDHAKSPWKSRSMSGQEKESKKSFFFIHSFKGSESAEKVSEREVNVLGRREEGRSKRE